MSELRLKTAIYGVSLLAFVSIAFADAENVPAQPATAAETDGENSTGAKAPEAAEPAASAPAPAAASITDKASTKSLSVKAEPAAMSTSEFYGFAFATRDAIGITFDSGLVPYINRDIWDTKSTGSLNEYKSKDGNMTFDFGARDDGGYEVITTSGIEKRASMTVFKNKKPVSHTIVGEFGAYTATETFCVTLRDQTKSKDFKDLAAKAQMCSEMYAQPETQAVGLDEHIKSHRANIARMEKSPAKPYVAKERAEYEASESAKLNAFKRSIAWIKSTKIPVKPRAILNRTSSKEDINDRRAITDLAQACGRLWNDGGARANATGSTGSGPTKSAVKK